MINQKTIKKYFKILRKFIFLLELNIQINYQVIKRVEDKGILKHSESQKLISSSPFLFSKLRKMCCKLMGSTKQGNQHRKGAWKFPKGKMKEESQAES